MSSERTTNGEPKQNTQGKNTGAGEAAGPEGGMLEFELSKFIISTLALEEITAEEITPEMPLFGGGLGLDSVDALELAVALQKVYGIKLDPKDESSIIALTCLKNLASLIAEHRKLGAAS